MVLTFDEAKNQFCAIYEGHYSLPDAKATFMTIVEALVQRPAQKVLVDARTVTGAPTTEERFAYSCFVAQAVSDLRCRGISPSPWFAYVMVEPVLDRKKFGETVAVNRGVMVRVFNNMEEAEHWLDNPDAGRSVSPLC